MKKGRLVILVLIMTIIGTINSVAQKTIRFYAADGISITADLFHVNDSLPYMILCHQAGSSRGEYLKTGFRFTKFGYNCLAIDARSGNKIRGVANQTARLAKLKNRDTSYLAAEQDIVAAINYVYDELSKKKVILVGSSYSASLVMKIAKENDQVKAVIAFSPGEYFGEDYSVKDSISGLTKPIFVTSSKEEAKAVSKLLVNVKSRVQQQYTPQKEGAHGSKMLWSGTPNHKEYWTALMMFMLRIKV